MCQLWLWEWNALILTPRLGKTSSRKYFPCNPKQHVAYKVVIFDNNLDSFVASPEYSLFKTRTLNLGLEGAGQARGPDGDQLE